MAAADVAQAFEPGLRSAIVEHFQARLDEPRCARYFRFEGAEIVNRTMDDGRVRAEVVFFVSYVSSQALYRDSPLATHCLGARSRDRFLRTAEIPSLGVPAPFVVGMEVGVAC